MRELLEQSLTFVTRSEALVNKTAWPLRGQLLAHAKTFLESFHASNKRKLVELLNNEQWQRCPIPRDYQLLIDAGFEKYVLQTMLTRSCNRDLMTLSVYVIILTIHPSRLNISQAIPHTAREVRGAQLRLR